MSGSGGGPSTFNTIVNQGPHVQYALLPASIGLAVSIPTSGNVVSATIYSGGYKNFAFGLKSSQAGTVSIQRYLDVAGTVPVGSAITGTLTANTATSVNNTDYTPYQSMIITVTNSSGSTIANLTNTLLLFQAG